MGIKTFNIDEEVYKEFSEHCKKNGISMSKRVENFIKEEISKIKSRTNSVKTDIKSPTVKKNISSESHTFSKYC